MLRWFECENCYSFANKAVLEMKAREPDEPNDNSLDDFAVEMCGERILRVASIYGANASGKSNFLKALSGMFWNICDRNTSLSGRTFFLDESYSNKPIVCKMSVMLKKPESETDFDEYIYGYELIDDNTLGIIVKKEYLFLQKVGTEEAPENLFYREYDVIKFGTRWNNHTLAAEDWKAKVKSGAYKNVLLMRLIGFDNSNSKPEHIVIFFEWCNQSVPPQALAGGGMKNKLEEVARKVQEDESFKKDLLNFLQKFDTCISNISVNTNTFAEPKLVIYHNLKSLSDSTNSQEERAVSIFNESHGTQKIAIMYLYLSRSWKNGGLLMFDELDTGLHPFVLREIISRFNSDKNMADKSLSKPQLIFTAHNLVALNRHDMHIDGIYFIEKNEFGISLINRLTKESMRPSEIEADIEYGKAYMHGRFGSISSNFSDL